MAWPGNDIQFSGQPVVLPSHPIRQRVRYRAEDRNAYFQADNGLLVPARQHRSASVGHDRQSPIQISIATKIEHSPTRGSRRPSPHKSAAFEDEYESPPRHRRRSRPRERSRYRERSRSSDRSTSRDRSRHRGHRRKARTPSPSKSDIEKRVKLEERMHKLTIMEQKEEEEKRRHQYEQDRLLMEAAQAEHKKREDQMKKLAIEEYNLEQAKKAAKAKEDKEKEEKAFRERVKTTFAAAGYSENSIEQILQKDGTGMEVQKKMVNLKRPTYIKVNRKHLSPDTLDAYSLPWEWDDVSCS